jgi:hypothetical protein
MGIKGSVTKTAGRRLAGETVSRRQALLAASVAAFGAGVGVYRLLRGGGRESSARSSAQGFT